MNLIILININKCLLHIDKKFLKNQYFQNCMCRSMILTEVEIIENYLR